MKVNLKITAPLKLDAQMKVHSSPKLDDSNFAVSRSLIQTEISSGHGDGSGQLHRTKTANGEEL